LVALALSPLFVVRHLRVVGADGLDPDVVLNASGLQAGQATWSVRPDQVRSRLERVPQLDDVRVVVRWPGTVELRVTPRVAVARQLPEGGDALVVAAGGVVLATDVDDSPSVLPIAMPEMAALNPGDRLEAALAAAVDIAGRLPVPIALRVVAASVDVDGNLTLIGRDGVAIRLGGPDHIDTKLAAVEAMLSGQVDRTGLCSLDVRNPKAAVLRRSPDCDPPPPPAPTEVPAVEAPPTGVAIAPVVPAPPAPASPFGGPGAPEPEVVVPDSPAPL